MSTIREKIQGGLAWWAELLPRERKMLSGGAGALVIILFWFGILSPWLAWQNKLTAELPRLRSDFALMQGLALQARSLAVRAPADAAALVGELQGDLLRRQLATPGQEIRQEGGGRLALSLKSVNFDDLLAWLDVVQGRYGLRVTSARFVRIDAQAGLVKADLVLEGGGKP